MKRKKNQKQTAEAQLADHISTVIDKNQQSIEAAENSFKIKKDKRKVKSAKKVKESTKAKKSNEAKEAMKEIEAKKNKNVAEPKDVPFSWIRKILEDKKTLKAGRDKQATY